MRGFKSGDEVYARPDKDRIGTFAERIAVAEADLARKPESISIVEAGSLPLVALTAWQALVEKGNLQRGQKVLIHAGAGGVGSIAIQLAKHLGATVATTASASNADFVRDLGADIVIDYRSEDFEKVVSGYDLVLDSLGGENLQKSLRILKPGGKAIGISGPAGSRLRPRDRPEPGPAVGHLRTESQDPAQAKKLGVTYEFLFMRASGDQLRAISALVDRERSVLLWARSSISTRPRKLSRPWPRAASAAKPSSRSRADPPSTMPHPTTRRGQTSCPAALLPSRSAPHMRWRRPAPSAPVASPTPTES